ncbi:MAG: alpha/beta hydrolase [Candidatus Omnitrophota bacterium]
MKKLMAAVFVTACLVLVLLTLAFFYMDISMHKGMCYDLYVNDILSGTVEVDRYVTEGRIVYKSSAGFFDFSKYVKINKKLSLKKDTMQPLRFTEEAEGVKGQKRLILLAQDGKTMDYLFLEHPRFISLEDIETGEDTLIFSPDGLMSYLPVLEKYNFWKKGAQFFDVMTPVDELLPPLRGRIEMRYVKDDYITVMGRKVEAEKYVVSSKTLPESELFLSKYTHRILEAEVKKLNMRFILVRWIEDPVKRAKLLGKRCVSFFFGRDIPGKKDDTFREEGSSAKRPGRGTDNAALRGEGSREIFFESGKLILSGRLWMPGGNGPFPAVLAVPKDGPMETGEQYLLNFLGNTLSKEGFVVLIFDSQGQGKSQGSFLDLDDGKMIRNITDACSYLAKQPFVKNDSIILIGHEGGGYLALRAASALPYVHSCILLCLPVEYAEGRRTDKEDIRTLLAIHGLGAIDEGSLETLAKSVEGHLSNVAQTDENISFFMGIKVPLKEYREYLRRRPYKEVISFDRPLLLVFAKNDKNFKPRAVESLKRSFGEKKRQDMIAIFRNLGPYLGEMTEDRNSLGFSMNRDVENLVKKWLVDNVKPRDDDPSIVKADMEDAGTKKQDNNI